MGWTKIGDLRERMEWGESQYLIDAMEVALQENASNADNPLCVALRALHRDSVLKTFAAIIDGGVFPVNRSRDNAQILEFLKELTGEL